MEECILLSRLHLFAYMCKGESPGMFKAALLIMPKIWNPPGQRPKGDQGIRWYSYMTEECVAGKEVLFPFSFNWHGLNLERKSTRVFQWKKQDTEHCLEYEPIWGGKRDIPFSLSLTPSYILAYA